MSMTSSTRNALECRVGLGRIALPTDAVDLLGEYVVGTRLPLNDRLQCAVGVWGDEPILSISVGQHDAAPTRTTNGALLVGAAGGIRCAFEIDEPLGLVGITEIAAATPSMPWRRTVKLADGRSMQLIDVPSLLQELTASPRRA